MDHTNYNMVDQLQLKGPLSYKGQMPINLIYSWQNSRNEKADEKVASLPAQPKWYLEEGLLGTKKVTLCPWAYPDPIPTWYLDPFVHVSPA